LPSMGQWYDIMVNLGGITGAPSVINYGWGWVGKASVTAAAINTYLNAAKAGGATIDLFDWTASNPPTRWYWSSTEYSQTLAWYFDLNGSGDAVIGQGGAAKNEAFGGNRIRSVIAF